jgi:phosphatidylglycerol lysyltransferase
VALGDPVGPRAEAAELIWRFREFVDRYDGWSIFYQVSEESLPVYRDLGMTQLRLGEEGRVDLSSFSLESAPRMPLQNARRRCQDEGCEFAVVEASEIPPLLPKFKEISTAWLSMRQTHEKGFSLAFFDESYLLRFPCAVVRRHGQIIAFANIWSGANREELSIDLIRYAPGSPPALMEYVFTETMLWGKVHEYRWFNLGLAPLSGAEDRPLAPLWNRSVNLDHRHGDHFEKLEQLRAFKEKFGPVWSSKYLASPGGLALPRILAAVTALVAGKHHVGTNQS